MMDNEDAYAGPHGGDRLSGRRSLHDRPVSRITTLNATLTLHPVWMWGLKPAFIGLLAVLALSPVLIVSPLVADAFNVDISITAVVVMACLVWLSATAAYLIARRSGVLDSRDRLPARKKRPRKKTSLVEKMLDVEDEAMTRARNHEAVRDLLRQAYDFIDEEQYEKALRIHRDGIRMAMRYFQRTDDYWLLYLALYAYYGTAFCALLTGRKEEATMAVETGIAWAGIGMERWPSLPQFVERQAALAAMKWKGGLEGGVYLPEDYSHWPCDD